ncbi:hypothetical protein D3C80_1280100 [compost metagenome]
MQVAAALEALGPIGFQGDQAGALGALGRVGLGDDDDEVGQLAVGDEGLGAVQDIVVARLDGGGLDALQVGAGARLGHGDGADQFARLQARQPARLLLGRAVVPDVGHDDGVVQRDAEVVRALPAQLAHQHDLMAIVAAEAAVFLGQTEAQQAGVARVVP